MRSTALGDRGPIAPLGGDNYCGDVSVRGSGYHEWTRSTPVLDAIGAVVAVASIIIGSYAALFLIGAVHRGDTKVAAECGIFLVGIALANGIVDALRHWRRHYD
jgi:hypothetical protein